MTTPTYRLSVHLERDDLDDDGMPLGAETMLLLDVESSDLAEAAAVLSAANDVISGRSTELSREIESLIPAELLERLRRLGD